MTDRNDDAPSSEELIRRARQGIAPAAEPTTPRPSPLPDRRAAASDPDEHSSGKAAPIGTAPTAPIEAGPIETGPIETGPIDPGPVETGATASPPVAGATVPAHAPADDSLLPEHFRPEPTTAGRSPGLGAVLASKWRWIVAGIFGVVFLFNLLTADTAVTDLSVGDCFMQPGGEEIDSVETVDCTEPHDFEVFALVDLTNRPGGFPGDIALFNEAGEACIQPFLDYIGITLDEFDFDVLYDYDVFIPVESSWDAGDREAMCALYATDGEFSPVRSSGSARG